MISNRRVGAPLRALALGLALVVTALTHSATAEEISSDLASRLTPAQQRAYVAYRTARSKFDREHREYWNRVEAKRDVRKAKRIMRQPFEPEDYVQKEPFPQASMPEGSGYVLKKPDHTGRWEVSTYVWMPSQIIVTEGDEVSLEFVGINGAEHPTVIMGYDKTLLLKRGHVMKLEFTADKAGTFPIVCTHHRPSMVAEFIVLPKR